MNEINETSNFQPPSKFYENDLTDIIIKAKKTNKMKYYENIFFHYKIFIKIDLMIKAKWKLLKPLYYFNEDIINDLFIQLPNVVKKFKINQTTRSKIEPQFIKYYHIVVRGALVNLIYKKQNEQEKETDASIAYYYTNVWKSNNNDIPKETLSILHDILENGLSQKVMDEYKNDHKAFSNKLMPMRAFNIEKFNVQFKNIIKYHFLRGMTIKEVSEVMNISTMWCYSLLKKGFSIIREYYLFY